MSIYIPNKVKSNGRSNWKQGEYVSSAHMNHIEDGIRNLSIYGPGYTHKYYEWHLDSNQNGSIYTLIAACTSDQIEDIMDYINLQDPTANITDVDGLVTYYNTTVKNLPNGSLLPNEYQEVEYIRSNGSVYYDTGVDVVVATDNITVGVYQDVNNNTNRWMFGTPAPTLAVNTYSGTRVIEIYLDSWMTSANPDLAALSSTFNKQSIYNFNCGVFSYDGVETKTMSSPSSTADRLFIFSRRGTSVSALQAGTRFYGATVKRGNTWISNLVPCYRKSDNVAGMYDLVRNTFITPTAGSLTGTWVETSLAKRIFSRLLLYSVEDNYTTIINKNGESLYLPSIVEINIGASTGNLSWFDETSDVKVLFDSNSNLAITEEKEQLSPGGSSGGGDTIPEASYDELGGIKLGTDDLAIQPIETVSSVAGRQYAVQLDINGHASVNVPWEGSSFDPNDYYWANIHISDSSSTGTTPQFGNTIVKGVGDSGNLQIGATNSVATVEIGSKRQTTDTTWIKTNSTNATARTLHLQPDEQAGTAATTGPVIIGGAIEVTPDTTYKLKVNGATGIVGNTTIIGNSIAGSNNTSLILYNPGTGGTPTDSPGLIFQRGALNDNYNDWKIYDSGGHLKFAQRGSGSTDWSDTVLQLTSGGAAYFKTTIYQNNVPVMTNPMTTSGDLILGGTSGAATRLAKGTSGQVLTTNSSGNVVWANSTGGGGKLYVLYVPLKRHDNDGEYAIWGTVEQNTGYTKFIPNIIIGETLQLYIEIYESNFSKVCNYFNQYILNYNTDHGTHFNTITDITSLVSFINTNISETQALVDPVDDHGTHSAYLLKTLLPLCDRVYVRKGDAEHVPNQYDIVEVNDYVMLGISHHHYNFFLQLMFTVNLNGTDVDMYYAFDVDESCTCTTYPTV